jgi:uncharacterized protein YbjQ (UPF0145 family)
MEPWFNLIMNVVLPILLLVVVYFIGGAIEKKHYKNIRARERKHRNLPAITMKSVPDAWTPLDAGLVSGSVVVSVDYFKRFLSALRAIFGGRVVAYETVLDRGRREAVLRMKEEAMAKGFNAVIHVRLESSRLASSRGDGKGTAGVEVLAYGTGLKLESTG